MKILGVILFAVASLVFAGPTLLKVARQKPVVSGLKGPKTTLVQSLDAGQKHHIVMYGTSLTRSRLWVSSLEDLLTRRYPALVKVTDSAKNGASSTWAIQNLEKRVLDLEPDAVFVEFAINDAYTPFAIPIADSRKNLEEIIDRILSQNPDCHIVLMTMNPVRDSNELMRPDLAAYYRIYRDVASQRGLMLIDNEHAWRQLMAEDPNRFDALVPDGLHPSDEGSRQVTLPTIVKTLGI